MAFKVKVDDNFSKLQRICFERNYRNILVIIGENVKNQIVNIHKLKTHINGAKPTVCWVYKKSLGFTTNAMKKLKQLRKKRRKLHIEENYTDAFWLFQKGTQVRYTKYRNTQKLLGNTFDMAILQDLEYITPNNLCHVIETIRGGGLIIFIYKSLSSFEEMFKFKLSIHKDILDHELITKSRFCERFTKSLTQCKFCLFMNNDYTILEIAGSPSSNIASIEQSLNSNSNNNKTNSSIDLLKTKYKNNIYLVNILSLCTTYDQANLVASIEDLMNSKQKKINLVISSRGRGKSSGLGLMLSLYLHLCKPKISVILCALQIENISTVFEFIEKGLQSLNYKDGTDYIKTNWDITNEDELHMYRKQLVSSITLNKNSSSVCFREAESIIQSLDGGQDIFKNTNLFVLDEAGSIPLHLIDTITKNSLSTVYLSTTMEGYEGSGTNIIKSFINNISKANLNFNQITLNEPIRYGKNDPIEQWLSKLLLLNNTKIDVYNDAKIEECELRFINRDILFEFSPKSEEFLKKLIHTFNTQSLSISPNHLIFLTDSIYCDIIVLIHNDSILLAAEITLEKMYDNNLLPNDRYNVPYIIDNYFVESNLNMLTTIRIKKIASMPAYEKFKESFLKAIVNYYKNSMNNKVNTNNCKLSNLLIRFDEYKSNLIGHYISAVVEINEKNIKLYEDFYCIYIDPVVLPIVQQHRGIFICEVPINTVTDNWSIKIAHNFINRFLTLLDNRFKLISPGDVFTIVKKYYTDDKCIKYIKKNIIPASIVTKLLPSFEKVQSKLHNNINSYISQLQYNEHIIKQLVLLYFKNRLPIEIEFTNTDYLLLKHFLCKRTTEHLTNVEWELIYNCILSIMNSVIHNI